MKIVLGHELEIQEKEEQLSSLSDSFFCKNCNIRYIHKWTWDEKWLYIPNVKTGPVWLELTCEEMIIKQLLE